jgi:hypothetical protein
MENRPLAGAEVWLLPNGKPSNAPWVWKRAAVTGEDGSFSGRDLKDSSLQVCLSGYLPGGIGSNTSREKPLRIELEPSAKISGRVIDPVGRPIAGARLTATTYIESQLCGVSAPPYPPPSPCGIDWEVTSDATGFFRFERLRAGWKDIFAAAEGYAYARDRREAITQQESTLEIVLTPGAVVTGLVQDSEGRPVSGAQVETSEDWCHHPDNPPATGVDGLYHLQCVKPGLQRIQATHDAYEASLVEVMLNPGDNLVDLTLGEKKPDVDEPTEATTEEIPKESNNGTAKIVGASEEGSEIARKVMVKGRYLGIEPGVMPMHLEARNTSLQTRRGVSSFYSYFIYLAPGEWEIFTRLKGRTVKGRIEILPDTEGATLDLDFAFGERTLSGRAVREGKPVTDVVFEIAGVDAPSMSLGPSARFGTFRFEKLREGRYLLRVKKGETILHEQEVDLSTDRELVIDLAEIGS